MASACIRMHVTALMAHISVHHEGAGLGLCNAVTALAGVLGALLGSWLAAQWGYLAAVGITVVWLTLGLRLSLAFTLLGMTGSGAGMPPTSRVDRVLMTTCQGRVSNAWTTCPQRRARHKP